jgi:hypothetical protein
MAKYGSDRDFTDYVHNNLALRIIYNQMKWGTVVYDEILDRDEGIDYSAKTEYGVKITIQERFRDNYYSNYNDITLRYMRESNPNLERRESEFFKIKADYLVYGITNGTKFSNTRDTLTDFIKYVVIDLKVLQNKITNGLIIIRDTVVSNSFDNNDGTMTAGYRKNPDGSSEFLVFDVKILKKLFDDDNIILLQKGFL